ncbi:hypothetical protein AeMF1_010854 [Aphanomyces euteiches]|nr:hypothetical protein AeMF1_010854 [Aphanomyces euteiches]KAH9189250.1 hypothetical protein AeNC1_008769 [Aphanomyces euteiches]
MGAGLLSKPTDPSKLDFAIARWTLTADVAAWLESLGPEYTSYKAGATERNIDGPLLCSLGAHELPILIECLAITNPQHVRVISSFFDVFKTAQRAAEASVRASLGSKSTSPVKPKLTTRSKTSRSLSKPFKPPQRRSKTESHLNQTPTTCDYHAYFSYASGIDSDGKSVRDRVAAIHAALLAKDVVVWFDSEKSVASAKLIDHGLLNSTVAVIFLTRSYMNQVNSSGALAPCQYEFSSALHRHTLSRMIFCVLDDDMMRYDSLTGEFREIVGDAECMDFTKPSLLEDGCDELAETIHRLHLRYDPSVVLDDVASLGVTTLVRFLKQPTAPPDLCEQVLQTMVCQAMQPHLADKMAAKGVLPLLLTWLQPSMTTERVVELSLVLFKVLGRSHAVTRRKAAALAVEMDVLPRLLDLLKRGSRAAMENAAAVIRTVLAADEVVALLNTTSDACQNCVVVLVSHVANEIGNLQYEAAAALCAIAMNRELQTLVVRANGIRVCLEQLANYRLDEGVRDNIALVLRHLSGSEAHQREIGSDGGVHAFLTLLETGSSFQQETSAIALNWLMEIEENRCILVEDDGISILVEHALEGSQLLCQQAFSALAKLALHSHFHEHLADAGALEPCLRLLEQGTESQKTSACHIVAALASTEIVHEMGPVIPLIVKLLYRGSAAQKRVASATLSKLGRRKALKPAIADIVGQGSDSFLL